MPELGWILITGGTGSFGKKFIEIALSHHSPKSIRVYSRDELKQHDLNISCLKYKQHHKLRFFVGDIRDKERLARAMNGVDVVIHAAGYYPSDSKNVPSQVAHSMQQTTNVLDLMRAAKAKRLIYTSSYTTMVPPLDEHKQPAAEEDYYQPGMLVRSAYYECKAAMEHVLLGRQDKDIEIVILNPTLAINRGRVRLF